METWQRIQTETRRDDEKVMIRIFSARTLRVHAIAAATLFMPIAFAVAQTPTPVVVVRDAKDLPAYAIKFPKPDYPYELRSRRIGGKGAFLLHIRRDGTVESVETLISTGHVELDNAAKSAFIKWQFRAGPTKAKISITFKPPSRDI
jgi:TonB family protein